MALPYFYIPTYDPASAGLTLDEDNSKHVVQVLRMQRGEALQLTDGKGNLLTANIIDDHKKKCRVTVTAAMASPPRTTHVTIAISPLKNGPRFEWFLEKAAEIGVGAIIPLLCERTERSSIRQERLQNILVSAMLQSQQTWLPALSEPISLPQLIREANDPHRYIAHCLEAPRATDTLAGLVREQTTAAHVSTISGSAASTATAGVIPAASLILIGPEGDFSPKEVEMALAAGYRPVSLGANRLRTETAGIVAATLLCIG